MNAEIIAVGSELLTPQRIDTNSLYLTDQLNTLGVEVIAKHLVGDNRARLASIVSLALKRAEVLLLTGGLGPTEDDVTRDAVAMALGRGQHFVEEILDHIERRFRRGNRVMAEINRRQAYLVDGAEALTNPNGTAPGQWIEHGDRMVVLLPGPPGEMKAMFESEVRPRLERRLPPQFIRTRVFRIAMMPESEVDQRVAPVYTRYTNPATTILAAGAGDIQLHFRARSDSAEDAERMVEELAAKVEEVLGERIYSRDGSPLEAAVGRRLRERGETVSVAESCTGGLIGERITSVPGSSDYFLGGFLVYNDWIKHELLGVPEDMLREHTAVSEPVAIAMARAARERTRSTYALSATGVAGPDGGTDQNPVGTVIIGLAGPDGSARSHRVQFHADRERVRVLASQLALDLLRKRLG